MSAPRIIDRPSPNFDTRTRAVDLVVLHYTGMQDCETALARLTDPAPTAGRFPGPWQPKTMAPEAPLPRVSAHYVVAEDGTIYRLVDEGARAWHAGLSNWRGESDVNARAIGVEIVNGGHDFGLPDFPPAQVEAVIALLQDILERRKLPPRAVVGHSDVAPERKLDPGEKFPWKRLAEAGVAVWPDADGGATARDDFITEMQVQLAAIGYAVQQTGLLDASTKAAIAAFQRRFRTHTIDGAPDNETRALLAALARAST